LILNRIFAFQTKHHMKDNIANGVITGLLGKKGQEDQFAAFLNNDKMVVLPPDSDKQVRRQYNYLEAELKVAKDRYKVLLEENMMVFQQLVQFETLITQFRCQLTIQPKFNKLVQKRKEGSKTYLIARAAFFDPKIKRNEIKVYLGEFKKFGTDLKKIEKDPLVIRKATMELFNVMNVRMGNALKEALASKNLNKVAKDFKFFHGHESK
jgi:hypothetical protein